MIGIIILPIVQLSLIEGHTENVDQVTLLASLREGKWQPESVSNITITVYTEWLRIYPSLEELYNDSKLIIRCKAVSQETKFSMTSQMITPRITTETTLLIGEIYKGTHDGIIIVSQSGGVYNGLRCISKDEITLEIGHEMVLYLNEGESSCNIVGGPQGMFYVKNDGVYSSGEEYEQFSTVTDKLKLNGIHITQFEALYLK